MRKESSKFALVIFLVVGAAIGYRYYSDSEKAEAARSLAMKMRAGKIREIQDDFSAALRPVDADPFEKRAGTNADACVAWKKWQNLQNFSRKAAASGLNLRTAQLEDEFISASRTHAEDLAKMVAYRQGILDCGESESSHVFLVDAAIDAVDQQGVYLGGKDLILADLRKVLIREIRPSVEEALSFLRDGKTGTRPDFIGLANEVGRHGLTAKELGISKLQLAQILVRGRR